MVEREQFKVLVKGMKAVYAQPTFIPDGDAFRVWYELLKDIPYESLNIAIQKHMLSNRFPPTIADIREAAQPVSSEEEMSEMEAWGYAYKALCNSNYNSEEEFIKLPELIKIAIGNPARLKEWAMLPMNEVQTVIQSNFMRSFKSVQIRQKEMRKLPEDIKKIMNYPEPEAIEDAKSGEKSITDKIMTVEKENFSASTAEFIDSLLEEFKEDYVQTG